MPHGAKKSLIPGYFLRLPQWGSLTSFDKYPGLINTDLRYMKYSTPLKDRNWSFSSFGLVLIIKAVISFPYFKCLITQDESTTRS